MRHFLISLIIGAIAVLWFSGANAGVRDPGVNERQHRQQERIAQGVRSGELTRHEARQLRTEQRAIRAKERSYKADGVLTAAERRDLHNDISAADRHIYRQKHDADRRWQ